MALTDKLTAIANAIRSKTGKTAVMTLDQMPTEIEQITVGESGGENTGDIETGEYYVKVIDYDGTVLAKKYLNSGEVFTLPEPPEHDRLIFDGWSASANVVNNTVTVENDNIMIGAMYYTKSGATEIDIVLTKAIGLDFTFDKNYIIGMTSIDWGDGTVDSTYTHTYATSGEYTIKIYGATAFGGGTFSFIDNTCAYKALRAHVSKTVTTLLKRAFYCWFSLINITLHSGITEIAGESFSTCNSLINVILPRDIDVVNNSIVSTCYSIVDIVIPYGVNSIGNSMAYQTSSLKDIVFPSNIASIGDYCFYNSYGLQKIKIPDSVMSIGTNWFRACNYYADLDFSSFTHVPALTSTDGWFNNDTAKGIHRIFVPSALYDEWIAAENWSNLANYIVAV